MLKRPHFIALGVAGLLALVVLNLPHHTAAQLKLAIGSLFLPLFGLTKSAHEATENTGEKLTTRAELLRENDALRRTNQVLQLAAAQAEVLLRDNNRLRQINGWQEQSPWKNRLRLAHVVARDPANWWQSIHIDLGSRSGMQADLPVLTTDGYLIGHVTAVSVTRSVVDLVGSPNFHVSARVEKSDRTIENGIISGGASLLDTTLVVLTHLPPTSTVKAGQPVVTSGMGLLPPGIRIGQVADAPRAAELGFAEARVKLGADPSALEEVWVLMP